MAPKDKTAAFAIAFGRAVREAREELELSQEELGFESELDRTYVSGVERGVRNPTLRTMLKICRALNLQLSELVARAEEA